MKTYTEEEYRALEQENIILLKNVEKLEFVKQIYLKIRGKDIRFRFKIVKILLAMSRRLNLLPDARQTGFFHEDASLKDISDFAEKCLERLKEAHNRDSLIENLGKEKVKWQETAECLDTTVNNFRKSFEDIRIWMESLCLALGISLGDLKDKLTNQVISTAIKKLIHEKAQLEKEADWLAGWLAKCDDLPCPEHPCSRSGKDGCLQCWRDAARKKMGKNEANSGSN